MPSDQPQNTLPESLRPYFQEYNFSSLSVSNHAELVIERVLNYGSLDELRWLFHQYGWAQITTWVGDRGEIRLSRRRYRLWCVMLEVVPDLSQSVQKTSLWPY